MSTRRPLSPLEKLAAVAIKADADRTLAARQRATRATLHRPPRDREAPPPRTRLRDLPPSDWMFLVGAARSRFQSIRGNGSITEQERRVMDFLRRKTFSVHGSCE